MKEDVYGNWVPDSVNGTHYKCEYFGNDIPESSPEHPKNDAFPVYPAEIPSDGGKLGFVGGTLNVSVYDGIEGQLPIHVMCGVSLSQFSNLLFSRQELVVKFVKWLYGKVT